MHVAANLFYIYKHGARTILCVTYLSLILFIVTPVLVIVIKMSINNIIYLKQCLDIITLVKVPIDSSLATFVTVKRDHNVVVANGMTTQQENTSPTAMIPYTKAPATPRSSRLF